MMLDEIGERTEEHQGQVTRQNLLGTREGELSRECSLVKYLSQLFEGNEIFQHARYASQHYRNFHIIQADKVSDEMCERREPLTEQCV
jgi:hypothetical protein